jgi:hypothetical protein
MEKTEKLDQRKNQNQEMELSTNREKNWGVGALIRISTAIVCRVSPMLDSLFLQNYISRVSFSVSWFSI